MASIKILKTFHLRLSSKAEKRSFEAGKTYALSAEEFKHWFVQGCIADGRAIEVPDEADAASPEEDSAESVPVTHAELMALKLDDLKNLAAACGLETPDRATKDQIATLLLSGVADICKDGQGIIAGRAQ